MTGEFESGVKFVDLRSGEESMGAAIFARHLNRLGNLVVVLRVD
jgi:hypothetical protein